MLIRWTIDIVTYATAILELGHEDDKPFHGHLES